MSKKPTAEEVAGWMAVNVRRIKQLRLITDTDIARRMGCERAYVTRILKGHYRCLSLRSMLCLANAMDMTLAELVSRPDDMSLLKQDQRKTTQERLRKKAKLKQTQEEQEHQALLESLGLAE